MLHHLRYWKYRAVNHKPIRSRTWTPNGSSFIQVRSFNSVCVWCYSPTRTQAALFLMFVDHTQLDTHIPRKTPLNEWSACRRGWYLHNKHERRAPIFSPGFKPSILAIKPVQSTRPPGSANVNSISLKSFWNYPEDRALSQAIGRRSVAVGTWVRFQTASYDIYGRQSGTGTGLSPRASVFLVTIITPMCHTHLLSVSHPDVFF
jgi:hypothetical protein